MSEIDSLILSLVNENASLEKIKEETKLYNSQLLSHLKSLQNKGYNIEKELSVDGIKIKLNKSILDDKKVQLLVKNNIFKFIVIADTHVGHVDDCLEKISDIYDYAAKKEINHIFHAGDLIEGIYCGSTTNPQEYCNIGKTKQPDILKQIEYFIKYYPKREKIITSYILGNHDLHNFKIDGIDISKIIENKRFFDMFMLGYHYKEIHINNRKIIILHDIAYTENILKRFAPEKYDITIHGHYHESKIKTNSSKFGIYMPKLYDIKTKIGAFEIIMSSSNQDSNLNIINIKPLVIDKEIYPITEFKYNLPEKKLVK